MSTSNNQRVHQNYNLTHCKIRLFVNSTEILLNELYIKNYKGKLKQMIIIEQKLMKKD